MSKLGPQETLVVEGDVLNADHDLGSDKDEEHLYQSAEPVGLTQLYKVEAVGGNRQGNVVHQPEHQILCNGGKMHGCKCTDGDEAPQAEVGEEQVVGDEHQRIGGDHHDKGQNDGLPELAAADLHAALCQVQAVLLAIAVIGHHHKQDGKHATEEGPHTDVPGGFLIPECRTVLTAPCIDGGVEDHAHDGTKCKTAPVPALALALGSGERLCVCSRLELCKVASVQKGDGGVDDEHKEASDAHRIEECLPLPCLVVGIQLNGSIQCLVKEGDAVSNNILGKVCPRVGDSRVEDDTDGFLAVDLLGVVGTGIALVQTGGVYAKMQEGLCSILVDVIPGSTLGAVCLLYPVEELVVLASNDTSVTAAKNVDPLTVLLVNGIVGHQQCGGDQPFLVLHHSHTAGKCAVGVTGNANAACINIGQASNVLYGIVKTVGVVLGIKPGAVRDDFRVAVTVHTDGDDHITSAGVLNIVEVLHLTVVVPAMAGNDRRSRVLSGGIFRHQQKGVQLVTTVGDHSDVVVLDRTAACLHYGCAHRAYKA